MTPDYKKEVRERFIKEFRPIISMSDNTEQAFVDFLDSLIDEVGVKAYSEGYLRGEDRVESVRKEARFSALREAEEAVLEDRMSQRIDADALAVIRSLQAHE